MKLKELIAKDKETIKKLDPKQKRKFIWDYYKLPIIFAGAVLAVVILALVTSIGRKKVSLYTVLINANAEGGILPGSETNVFTELLLSRGYEEEKAGVDVQANYTLSLDGMSGSDAMTMQVLSALFGVGDLDLFASNEEVYKLYSDKDAFVDLSLFLEKEDLAGYTDGVYVCENSDGQKITAGIWLRDGSVLHRAGYFSGPVILGVTSQAEHLEEAVDVVKAIVEGGHF